MAVFTRSEDEGSLPPGRQVRWRKRGQTCGISTALSTVGLTQVCRTSLRRTCWAVVRCREDSWAQSPTLLLPGKGQTSCPFSVPVTGAGGFSSPHAHSVGLCMGTTHPEVHGPGHPLSLPKLLADFATAAARQFQRVWERDPSHTRRAK